MPAWPCEGRLHRAGGAPAHTVEQRPHVFRQYGPALMAASSHRLWEQVPPEGGTSTQLPASNGIVRGTQLCTWDATWLVHNCPAT